MRGWMVSGYFCCPFAWRKPSCPTVRATLLAARWISWAIGWSGISVASSPGRSRAAIPRAPQFAAHRRRRRFGEVDLMRD